jgi:hypothetical protein
MPIAVALDVSAETREGRARALLAGLLDRHRREDKPASWRYFDVRTLGERNLIIPNGQWLYGPSQALSPFLIAGSGRVVR